ncbi:MAG TPA: putative sugar O-methyltransferase [Terracidiphilus sp.]|nr:putative sugar O-methyltransferase [Terracidiphilus sp.]
MIKPGLKHLRHPLRTLGSAARIASMHREIKRLGHSGAQHFRGDPRYKLANVSTGFASRPSASTDDTEILSRICAAYVRAAARERSASEVYHPSGWWRQIRQASLGPVTQALAARDISSLRRMYGNLFRDPCSTGLVGVPFGMKDAYFGRKINDLHRRYLLADTLHAVDCWQEFAGRRFALRELAMPQTGNPFGVMIDGTLVQAGAAYHHASAHRVIGCLGSGQARVVEIGGGFGAMACFLLRDRPLTTYIDFDLPESLALIAYYLMKAFPQLRFLLYGESEFSPQSLRDYDIALMPLWEMQSLAGQSADVVFSSHAISDISGNAMAAYLRIIARIARGPFLYMGNPRGAESICRLSVCDRPLFHLQQRRAMSWNAHKIPPGDDVECIFTALTAPAMREAEEVVA